MPLPVDNSGSMPLLFRISLEFSAMVVLLALALLYYRYFRSYPCKTPTSMAFIFRQKVFNAQSNLVTFCSLTKGPMPSPTPRGLFFFPQSLVSKKRNLHVLEGSALRPARCCGGPSMLLVAA